MLTVKDLVLGLSLNTINNEKIILFINVLKDKKSRVIINLDKEKQQELYNDMLYIKDVDVEELFSRKVSYWFPVYSEDPKSNIGEFGDDYYYLFIMTEKVKTE